MAWCWRRPARMPMTAPGAIGTAISLAVYYGLQGTQVPDLIVMEGRSDNVHIRLAAMVALGVSMVFLLLTILSVAMTVPKGGGSRDVGKIADSPAPKPQLPPDDARNAIIDRLATLSLSDLERLEKQILVDELADLEPGVLRKLVEEKRS